MAMSTLLHHLALSAPLFVLIFLGFGLMHWGHWPAAVAEGLSRLVFSVALPGLLFHLMSDFSRLPPVDARLLIAFFGSCLIVFVLGRLVAWRFFGLDGVAQSVFGLGGVFSNNVLLGVPLAKVALGEAALPAVALVLVFNALTLWTLVTVSVEWSRHGSLSLAGFGKTLRGVLTNPIVVSILSGTALGLSGWHLPEVVETPLSMLAQSATPLSLIALGMGLSEYGVGEGWRISGAMAAMKLVVQPLMVWLLAWSLGLPPMETRVVVLLGAISTGVNVYLMSRQFRTLEGPVASSLVITTVAASVTIPLILTLLGAASGSE